MEFGGNLIDRLRSALALALMLWCAGTGCVLVSYAKGDVIGGSSPARIEDAATSTPNSSCHAQHASQKQQKVSAQTRTNPASEMSTGSEQIAIPENRDPFGSMSCCPLAVGMFVVASRAHSNDSNTATVAQRELPSLSLNAFDLAPYVYPLRSPQQDQTYLRCCSFLI